MLAPFMAERWWAYFVACADGSLYAGATNDLNARVEKHNCGKGARYTRSRRPVKLVWSRAVTGRSSALSLEAKLKRLPREEKLRLIRTKRVRIAKAAVT